MEGGGTVLDGRQEGAGVEVQVIDKKTRRGTELEGAPFQMGAGRP